MESRRITASHASTNAAPEAPSLLHPLPSGRVRDEGADGGLESQKARLELKGPLGAQRRGAFLRRLLAAVDWLALLAALAVANGYAMSEQTFLWALVFSPSWILVLKLHGLYDHDHRRIRHSTLDEVPTFVSATALGILVLNGLLAISPGEAMSASSAILVGAVALAGSLAGRAGLRVGWHRLTGMANGIVIGSPQTADVIARRVAIHPEARLQLVGYLGPDNNGNGSGNGSLAHLGGVHDIPAVARNRQVERVIVAEDDMSDAQAERMIRDCKAAGVALTFLPRHHALLGPGVELNRLAELPVLDFRFSAPPRSTLMLKRLMDIVISGSALILLSPLFLATSLLILLDSGSPVLFRQTRAGKGGRPFRMLKFRTMVSDAELRLGELVNLAQLDEPAFKIPNDPRVTRVGRVLRRFSLDELPQLLNVLRGEMSLVGPRPEEEAVVALYDERQRTRLTVKPGLTGPMQIYGRGDLTFEERLALERDYLDNLSVAGDLAILTRTPLAILRGHGAY
jgi:exopolysaccharide biosynthesis polyprenyl glycosylphosphotransferase